MTVTYRPASEPKRIAERLIPEYHPHLEDVRIDYVFRSEAAKSNGKIVLGKARKVTGLNAFLATDPDERPVDDEDVSFFVIEIAEDTWAGLTRDQRIALVDHELCHCIIEWKETDEGSFPALKLKGHDLEEFRCIVDRHGLWDFDVAQFADTIAHAVRARYGTDTIPTPSGPPDDDYLLNPDGHDLAELVGLIPEKDPGTVSVSSEGPSSVVDATAGGTVVDNGNGTRTVTLDADQLTKIRSHLAGGDAA